MRLFRLGAAPLAVLVTLVACKTVATDARTTPDAAVKPIASERLPAAPIERRAWATAPPKDGPLYPIVDGPCEHVGVYPVGEGALFSAGRRLFGRLADDGLHFEPDLLRASDPKTPFSRPLYVTRVAGTWPGPLLLHGIERSGRLGTFETTWSHDENGWTRLGDSHDEEDHPAYARPILHRGWYVTARSVDGRAAEKTQRMLAIPAVKGARPIAGLAQLARPKLIITDLWGGDESVFAYGESEGTGVLRELRDGMVSEINSGAGDVIGTSGNALFSWFLGSVWKIERGKKIALPYKAPPSTSIVAASLAPNGDLWVLTSRRSVVVLHGETATETVLPAAAKPPPDDTADRSGLWGSALAGVEVDDPYALGAHGEVFHLTEGTWREVPLPPAPFATTGKYRAVALSVPTKGELYVEAAYSEKGFAWTSARKYRALLRNKRPPEVLRCSTMDHPKDSLVSFPPIADEACPTPFVIFSSETSFLPDYPGARAAIKETPSLGATVDLVEVISGEERIVGVKVPSVAAGHDLLRAAVKHTGGGFNVRYPEIVCGTPKEERVTHVDVKTGELK